MKIVEQITRESYIMVQVEADSPEVRAAERWCRLSECGKQVSARQFSFKKESDLTMFTLRWITK